MRSMGRKGVAALLLAVAVGMSAGQIGATDPSDRLTADEVRATFVDREWSQGTGTFLFAGDGTYRYADTQFSARGSYQIAEDGVLCTLNEGTGRRTCYTFYRDGDGYRYWHDRSEQFWPAYLR